MASTLQGTHRLPCRIITSTWLRALATNRVLGGANTRRLSADSTKQHDRVTLDVATYAERSSGEAFYSTISSGGAKSAQQQRWSSYSRARSYPRNSLETCRPCSVIAIPLEGWSLDRANTIWRNGQLRSYISAAGHANSGSSRAFGGQSVVPWELALFLVEEMKGEGVEPGAVVYTAALAECRWAGEEKHVEYLRQQMDAEGMKFVPGIPGATDNDLPPSQAPPIFYSKPSDDSPQKQPPDDVATAAARIADTALATVEALSAAGGGDSEPSSAIYRAALDACAAGGQWERALSLVRDSVDSVDGSDGGGGMLEDDESIVRKVERLAVGGLWGEAFALVQRDTRSAGAT